MIRHFKNLVPHGLPLWLVPIMFALELLSMLIKPFALCIRLFANMMAGPRGDPGLLLADLHSELAMYFSPDSSVWIGLARFVIAFELFVHLLEILVAFLQAYIFTMLTANFIGMSIHPGALIGPRIQDSASLVFEAFDRIIRVKEEERPHGIRSELRYLGAGSRSRNRHRRRRHRVSVLLAARARWSGIARQPQSAATIQTAMLIAAALIEGATLLALVICILIVLMK